MPTLLISVIFLASFTVATFVLTLVSSTEDDTKLQLVLSTGMSAVKIKSKDARTVPYGNELFTFL